MRLGAGWRPLDGRQLDRRRPAEGVPQERVKLAEIVGADMGLHTGIIGAPAPNMSQRGPLPQACKLVRSASAMRVQIAPVWATSDAGPAGCGFRAVFMPDSGIESVEKIVRAWGRRRR